MPQSTYNKIIVFISMVIIALFVIFGNSYKRPLGADSLLYYMYLPSTFIYHNNESLDKLPGDKQIPRHIIADADYLKTNKTPKGYPRNQYTYGVAFMEMPFFFIAHAWEKVTKKEANGYSETYTGLLDICDLFYAIAGLIIMYITLKMKFSETQSLLTILILFLGTNLFWFTLFQSGMSHVPLFFLYSVLIYGTVRVHEKPSAWLFLLIGFTAGMITVIRPSDVICLLIPFLYNIYDKDSFNAKIHLIKNNAANSLLAFLMFLLPIIPQLIYWKIMTGSYVYYSYGDQKFNWTHPKILEGIFSAHNGWLFYTPVMIFSLIGLLLINKVKPWHLCLWTILPIYVYITYSWYCYNYINGFGSRPMINLYPLLAIPLTGFIQLISKQKPIIKFAVTTLFLFFIAVNLSFSVQFGKHMLNSENSNLPYALHILFHSHLDYNDLVTNDIAEIQPDSSRLTKIATLAYENFNDSASNHYERDTTQKSGYFYHMSEDPYHPKTINVLYNKTQFRDAKWFKGSGKFMRPSFPTAGGHCLVLNIDNIKWCGCGIDNKIGILDGGCPGSEINLTHFCINEWGEVSFFAKIPENMPEGTKISLLVWNICQCDICIDDLRLEIYK